MTHRRRVERLLLACSTNGRSVPSDTDRNALAELLDACLERVHVRWSTLRIDEDLFVDTLANRWPDTLALEAWLGTVHAEELYLASACAAGDGRAHSLFDQLYLMQVATYVRTVNANGPFADEVKQELREKLLLGSAERPPRIAKYEGRGALAGWIRLAAIRTARDLISSKASPKVQGSLDVEPASPARDPQQEVVKARTTEAFRAALESAVAGLSSEERAILKLHFLEGMRTDDIGRLYGVDGSTIRRRAATIRAAVLKATRKQLTEALALPPREVESLIGAAESGFEASISRWLS